MARRLAALRPAAPPASLALAATILIVALLLLASAGAASAKPRSAPEATTPADASGGAREGAPVFDARAQAQAEREARGAPRKARKQGGEAGPAPVSAPSGGGSTAAQEAQRAARLQAAQEAAQKRAERQAERAQRQAERTGQRAQRAAERAAARSGHSGEGGSQGNAGAGAGQPAARGRSHKEREKEVRRRQREARSERGTHRETRKEREAREANEARAAGGSSGGGSAVPTAATAAATTPGLAPPVAPAVKAASGTGPTGSGARSTRKPAARPRGRHGAVVSSAALGGGLALRAVATEAAATHAATHRSAPAAAGSRRHAAAKSSPLVTTVTRIIGVIPTAVWLVIGGLGLIALLFAVSSRMAGRRARWLARQREELLEDVGLLQAALLPALPSRLGPVGTTAAYRPASGPAAGGDFYDVFGLANGCLAVIVGDVSGHGREALPHTTLVRFTLRAYLEAGLSPREALQSAAPVLKRQLGESFATVVLASYDPRRRELTYACAGHPHPVLSGLDGDAPIIACSAPPIGAGRRTGTRQTIVAIPGGTTACFYTDGVIEARTDGELFGTARLERALDGLGPAPSAAALLDRVAELTDRRPDDMAACLLEVRAPAGSVQRPFVEREELELDEQELARQRPRRFLAAAGVGDAEAEALLAQARATVHDHGSALLQVRPGADGASGTVIQSNLAPLRARSIARSQEVAL